MLGCAVSHLLTPDHTHHNALAVDSLSDVVFMLCMFSIGRHSYCKPFFFDQDLWVMP